MRLRGLRGDDFYTGEELIAVQVRQEELNFDAGGGSGVSCIRRPKPGSTEA